MIKFIIFGVPIIVGFVIWIIISNIRKAKYKKNAITAFSESRSSDDSNLIILTASKPVEVVRYLNYLLRGSSAQSEDQTTSEFIDKKVIININDGGENIFLNINTIEKNVEVLINPKNKKIHPVALPYESFDVVKLIHKTYSETSGSGDHRTTTYYNQYITRIGISSDILSEITVYNGRTQVSGDKGVLEVNSRQIGELFAKLLKMDVIRTDGTIVKYSDLDASILEKLDALNVPRVNLRKNIFTTAKLNDSYVINQLLFYKAVRLTLGIIFSSLVFIAGLVLGIKFATWLSIFPVIALFVVFLIVWIKSNKYKTPYPKPIIYVYKDQLIVKPKFKSNVMVSGVNIDLSSIEEIVVRYEKSKGFVVKAISDEKIFDIAVFSHEDVGQFIRNEILSLLEELK